MSAAEEQDLSGAVAIVGMAGRFPGARSVEELWRNLCSGLESITRFRDEELAEAGVDPALRARPEYVAAKGIVDGVESFDREFFGISARLAEAMDPQQRLVLESAWEALEDAGYEPETFAGAIGVFVGSAPSSYLLHHVMPNLTRVSVLGELQITAANDKDYLATQVSYKLNLRGPSLAVQTACSSSLVAVHLACQSLLGNECDLALAGGVSLKFPHRTGYLYQEGGILSPDGHCRPFDSRAAGTVSAEGVGLVALRRYADAVADGDSIRALILGSAINNDGARKLGFSAPSLDGQAKVIAEALAVAGVAPETIGAVEAHGTGTAVGDPIEVGALHRAFGGGRRVGPPCALGSLKGNLGHLDTAAGVAGLIKMALAVERGLLPPSLHFEKPNPEIEFERGPFAVNTELRPWPTEGGARRAAVSSFGLGGTNAHAVLQEPPAAARRPGGEPGRQHLLLVSARSEAALEDASRRLARRLEEAPDLDPADVAFTSQVGRRAFEHRRAVVFRDLEEARAALLAAVADRRAVQKDRPVAFLFPGQGTQSVGMAGALYAEEPVFRVEVDRACEGLAAPLGLDLRPLLLEPASADGEGRARLAETFLAQPALFVVEYALARLWMSWGVVPQALLGHSVGEIVAATLSGVFRFPDALALVAARGRLMQALPRGGMLSVALPASEVEELLDPRLALAAVNARDRSVVAGESGPLAELEGELAARGVSCRRLDTSHAFHSPMMEPALAAFAEVAASFPLGAPKIPWVSNVTGTWITPEEARDPGYWASHLRRTVRFADGLDALLAEDRVLLEVGPGRTLTSLARRAAAGSGRSAVASAGGDPRLDRPGLLAALAELWLGGAAVDWRRPYRSAPRRRVPLPTYPFERQRAWLEPSPGVSKPAAAERQEVRVPAAPAAAPAPPGAGRAKRIEGVLCEIVGDLLGAAVEKIDVDLPFLEVGIDSLVLIQASQAIHRRLGVKLTLAQLLEQYTTIGAVAVAIDAELPANALAEDDAPSAAPFPAQPGPAAAETAGAPGPEALQRIVNEQLRLMARQIELLSGAMGAPVPGSPIAPPREEQERAPGAPSTPVQGSVHPFAAPPVLAEASELSARQEGHLRALVARYCARTAESKRRTDQMRPHLAENRASVGFRMRWKEMVYPLIAERSAGARIWDVDGNEYVDLAMGFTVHFFGHNPEFVTRAVEEQLRRGVHLGPQSDLAGEVARRIVELTGMERVTFTNSGTESVMTALRLARAVTGRGRVALFSGSYHGSFDGVLARAFPGGRAVPSSPGVPRGMSDDLLVLDYGSPEALAALRAAGSDLAAVLVEPVQSRRLGLQPREFLHDLRRLTQEVGAALIFDEVISGFRIHPGGAQAWFGVRADIATYGKVLGGGMPIGIVAGSAKFMDAIDGGAWTFGDDSYPRTDKIFFAGTFCKHPLAMAAARAVLERLEAEGPALQERLNRRTAALVAELEGFFTAERVPIRVIHFASMFRFELTREADSGELFFHHLIEKGVYTWEGRTCCLSTAHTEADLRLVVRAVEESVRELRAGGFLLPEETVRPAGAAAPPERLPLTAAQRGIWSLCQLDPAASGAFNESIVCRLEGALAPGSLGRALQRVVDRHEALRVTFEPEGERQVIHPRVRIELPLVDLSSLPVERRGELEADLGAGAQGRELFDLVAGPLLRVRLFRFSAELHILDLTVHHLVTDGWSLGLLLNELRQLYAADLEGRTAELPPPTSFRWYVELQEKRSRGEEGEAAEAYWLARFADGVPRLDLPADRPRPPVKSYRGGRASRRLEPALTPDLRALAREQRSTPFILLLAAFEALLRQLAGTHDLVVGITLAEQPSLGTEAQTLMGYCLNVLPLRVRGAVGESFRELLADTRRALAEAQEHQSYDVARLFKKLDLRRDPGRSPLFSVAFNHERGEVWKVPGGLRFEQAGSPNVASQYDLSLMTVELGGEIAVHCIYSADLFDRERIEGWLADYERLLAIVVREPGIGLAELGERLRREAAEERRRTREQRRGASLAKLRALEGRPLASGQGS